MYFSVEVEFRENHEDQGKNEFILAFMAGSSDE